MKQQQMSSFGQLTHPAQLILLGLQDHPMGGGELLAFLKAGKCWLEPGTLWAMLSRLERAGLISPFSTDGSWHEIRRYHVTDAGDLLLSQERNPLFGARERIGPRPSRGFLQVWIMILIKWIVRLYPKAWRERYEQEMIELLGAHEITFWTWLDLLWNALDARLDPFYRRSVLLSPFRRLRRVQWAILAAVFLPLLSALFYLNLFNPITGGLHGDYWIRNEHYPILAWVHELGSLGVKVTVFSALLSCIALASQGIKRFGRAGDVLSFLSSHFSRKP